MSPRRTRRTQWELVRFLSLTPMPWPPFAIAAAISRLLPAPGPAKRKLCPSGADLIAGGASADSIVAFTFTERAANELKRRIQQRIEHRLGKKALDSLNGCFVGTIHGYCFQLLREHVAKYETCDVLDDNRMAALLSREKDRIGLQQLATPQFTAIREFMRNYDVVENELIPRCALEPPFGEIVARFDQQLSLYRFLTYGRLIASSVNELVRPEIFASVHNKLRHLIVDEYQDINPAQEALIRRLSEPPVELCVVGDDDQSIYQWRGSDVQNIVKFTERHNCVAPFSLLVNRRSRPRIIAAANTFAATIRGRLAKTMSHHRQGGERETVAWRAPTEREEAGLIATTIHRLHETGYRFRDIAVLVRSSTSYKRLLDAFAEHNVPVQPGGRTGLFLEADAQAFGRMFAFLAGHDWRSKKFGERGCAVALESLVDEYARGFRLNASRRQRVSKRLVAWKGEVSAPTEPANLIGDFYDLLADCGVGNWDFNDPVRIARLGCLARFSAILADYESVRRRARPDPNDPAEMIGGTDRGHWYYRGLAIHIQNWALGEFDGFEGEENFTLDAVDLTTVHKAKGLEWPIVFVPCVSSKRFPSSNTGRAQVWHIPENHFDKARYEGSENDERRLFYVAMTRARDWLSVSTHDTPNRQRVEPSPFLVEFAGGVLPYASDLPLPPPPEHAERDDNLLSITFSELANYRSCGLSYRLRNLIGFQPALSPELGYGKAVHHMMRRVAEQTRRNGSPPTPDQLNLLFDSAFYLPAASKPGHKKMKAAARRLVDRYIENHGDDLRRVWAVERPFELHLPNGVISGRADVILEETDGHVSSLAIVDYKTSADDDCAYEQQLQIYADAGCREGLDVRAAYIHDLHEGRRIAVDVSSGALEDSEAAATGLIDRLNARVFEPNPGSACRRCDVKAICRFAA